MKLNAQAVLDTVTPVTLDIDPATGLFRAVTPGRDEHASDLPGIVFPGFLDFHVHAREFPLRPGDPALAEKHRRHTAKEDFASAGQAAVQGGVVGIAEMPNNPIPPDNAEVYEEKRRLTTKSAVPVLPIAAITEGSAPFADVPYKMMMNGCCGGIAFADIAAAEETVQRYKGCFVIFHCEDPELLRTSAPGERQPLAEVRAIERVLEWTARYGLESHVAHISTKRGVELIAEYNRSASTRVRCEVTPHHLCMSRQATTLTVPPTPLAQLARGDLLFMNPPLRDEEDRRFLLEGLKTGLIDFLATDHAPHTLEDKAEGAPGLAHLDTLGSFACWLLTQGFTPRRLAEVMAEVPGALFSRFLQRPMGKLAAGYAASLVALDTRTPMTVQAEDLKTRCGWSGFEGLELPGRVLETWVDGACRFRQA